MMLILPIMGCSMIGTVLLIGLCSPLHISNIPTAPAKDDTSSIAIEESFQDSQHFNDNHGGSSPRESIEEGSLKARFREWIASSSVPILRLKGMTDEEIKSELLRDFALTGEQVDKILAAQ